MAKSIKWKYGWDNGRLEMEKIRLSKEDEELLREMTDIAFREMGREQKPGSGDDQAYVDGLYGDLKKDRNSEILARVMFRLCRQANDSIPKSRITDKIKELEKGKVNSLWFKFAWMWHTSPNEIIDEKIRVLKELLEGEQMIPVENVLLSFFLFSMAYIVYLCHLAWEEAKKNMKKLEGE